MKLRFRIPDKKTQLIIVVLLLLAGWFYWFEWRPASTRKACNKDAVERMKGMIEEGNKNPEQLDLWLNRFYESCMKRHGLAGEVYWKK